MSFDHLHSPFCCATLSSTFAYTGVMIVDITTIGAEPVSSWAGVCGAWVWKLIFMIVLVAYIAFNLGVWIDLADIHWFSDLTHILCMIFGAFLTDVMVILIKPRTTIVCAFPIIASIILWLIGHHQFFELISIAFFPHRSFLLVCCPFKFEFASKNCIITKINTFAFRIIFIKQVRLLAFRTLPVIDLVYSLFFHFHLLVCFLILFMMVNASFRPILMVFDDSLFIKSLHFFDLTP